VASTQQYNGGQFRALRVVTAAQNVGGWRLLSSPMAISYGDLFSGIITQGYPGSTFETLMPNVLWYDESIEGTDNQRWLAPTGASQSTVPGRGLFTYIFGDMEDDDTRYDQDEAILDVVGQENQGDVALPVTYSPDGDQGWNLVGNPFLATIDWANASGWTDENIDASIYIYDHANGSYLVNNGSAGDPHTNLIKPFQGFWVKANDDNPSLVVRQAAKTTNTDGAFYRHRPEHNEIVLRFESGDLRSTTYVMFSEDARSGKDPMDAYRLRSLGRTFIEAYTVSRDGDRLAINNLPSRFSRPVEIPLNIDGLQAGGAMNREVTLHLDSRTNIPAHWHVEIIDNRNGKAAVLQTGGSTQHTFRLTTTGQLAKSPSGDPLHGPGALLQPEPILYKSSPSDARFTLRITPTEADPDVPSELMLMQNYPNPFNPATTIPYALPTDGRTQLHIYDITGRRVATLVDAYQQAGRYQARFDASSLSSGIYLYRLITVEGSETRRMTFIK
jgi:hypothetical protein